MRLFQYLITLLSYIKSPNKRRLIRLSYDLRNETGIEIGGPSAFFSLKSYFPVYVFAKTVDGVNFSDQTYWEGKIHEGHNYQYAAGRLGFQYIGEASEVGNWVSKNYDFLLSCHSLEHVANPVKALKGWNKVLRPRGKIVLVLPDKENTFDFKRPYTTFEHLLEDFKTGITEGDTTHLEEIFRLHDIGKDANINSVEELRERAKNNLSNRYVHHHVYSLALLDELLVYCGFKILHKQKAPPFHLVIVGEKITAET